MKLLVSLRQFLAIWFPQLAPPIWILAAGRLLSQTGTGLTLFYLPIFFVNQVGLSATAVGIGLGSASVSGIVGRVLGGSMTDSRQWGRRRTLLLSIAISAIASLLLAIAHDFNTLVLANLILGLGVGLYWPATEAAVADLSGPRQRNEAYALTRLADNLGLGVGVVLGGVWIALVGAYRMLFVIDALSFLVFFGVVYRGVPETAHPLTRGQPGFRGWAIALQDTRLLVYVLVNVMITTYLAQIYSTLPLYLKNFVNQGQGFETLTISSLLTWNLSLSVLGQLPVARWLNRFTRPQALMVSVCFWAAGLVLVWVSGTVTASALVWAGLGMSVLAIAMITYTPAASSLVADLAPDSLRGIYLSINSLCWAVGYFIGPPLGGWALDQPRPLADQFWLALALSTVIALGILQVLNRIVAEPFDG